MVAGWRLPAYLQRGQLVYRHVMMPPIPAFSMLLSVECSQHAEALQPAYRLRVYDLPVDALEASAITADGGAATLAAAPDSIVPPLRIKVRA